MQTPNPKKIYFLGIAGQLMSALACVAKEFGYEVTGSDENAYPPATDYLDKYKIPYVEGHKPENIKNPDLIVLGNHIRKGNPELEYILEKNLPFISCPQLVGLLFPDAKYRMVVAGTHGKSTTTSLLGWILFEAGLNPTVLIGAKALNFGNSFHVGSKDLLVIEGDEYTSSCLDDTSKFLYYNPTHTVITSIELDHMDVFDTWEKQIDTFEKLAMSTSKTLLLCGDTLTNIASHLETKATKEKYGLGHFDWQATNIKIVNEGTSFDVLHENKLFGNFFFPLVGTHYIQDALSAIVLAQYAGASLEKIQTALTSFKGVGQRFEIIDSTHGAIIIDDYAHHPTAIKVTLEAARAKYPKHRIWCIYEPHTFTRIKGLLSQFKDAFVSADLAIIADIMPAREKALVGLVHAKDIVDVARNHPNIQYLATPDEVFQHLKEKLQKDDVVIIMAVGKFGSLSHKLAEYLKGNPLL